MNLRSLIIASAILTVSGCRPRPSEPLADVKPLEIRRLDRAMENSADSAAMLTLLDIFSMARPDTISIDEYLSSRAMTVFRPDIDSLLPPLNDAEAKLGEINTRLTQYLPKARVSEVYGVVNPFNQAVIVADSTVFIGLNHYLGSGYQGYASFDSYIRRRKTPGRIPYDFAEAVIAINYPYCPDSDCTAVNRLLYEGALVHAILKSVPESTLEAVLGYSDEKMDWIQSNEAAIWQTLIARDLLYSMDSSVESRLVNPSPATTVISQEAPGSAGRFIGYRIVESYIGKHPDITISYLLSPAFYRSPSSLVDSGYSPGSDRPNHPD